MMDSQSKVSVVLPTYNRADLLPRAVNTVLNQTYQNLELIIVDDCSTDNTSDVVESIEDIRVVYIKLDENKGANHARNVGISAASSDFIAFQDSDDEWLPNKLQEQMALFEKLNENVAVVYCSYKKVDGNGELECRPFNEISPKNGNIIKPMLYGNFITTQSVVVRKLCFHEVGLFDEQLSRFQDWELFIRLAERYEFRFVDKPLLNTYFTKDSITADNSKLLINLSAILNKHIKLFNKFPTIKFKHNLSIFLGRYLILMNSFLSKYPEIKKIMRRVF